MLALSTLDVELCGTDGRHHSLYSSIFRPRVFRWMRRSFAARERLPRWRDSTFAMKRFSNSRRASPKRIPLSTISAIKDSSSCFTDVAPYEPATRDARYGADRNLKTNGKDALPRAAAP